MYGLHRCQINIPITLTAEDNAEHNIVLQARDDVLDPATVSIVGTPTMEETLSAIINGSYAVSKYQWLASDAEKGTYIPLSEYTQKTLKLDEDFFDYIVSIGVVSSESTVYIRVEARNESGESEAQSDPVFVQ